MLNTVRSEWVDFLSLLSLSRRAGAPAETLAIVAAKELLDNALDASATGADYDIDTEANSFTVQDRGPGLSEDEVKTLFSINRPSVSSKRWRLARRGALGNGLRVVCGVAFVSGGHVVIESRGQAYTTTADMLTGAQSWTSALSAVVEGARITLFLGAGPIPFPAAEIDDLARKAVAVAGSSYGGTRAVPAWFTDAELMVLARDMASDASVLSFARNFDVTDGTIALLKQVAMRTTVADMLQSPPLMAQVIEAIRNGDKQARSLRKMGRNARSGSYASCVGDLNIGNTVMPCIVEVWATSTPAADKKTTGRIAVETLFANRTPALMDKGSGYVFTEDRSVQIWLGNANIRLARLLKAPCDFGLEIALTAPELPIVSDGKAVDIHAFGTLIADAVQSALLKAYTPPVKVASVSTSSAADKPISIKDAVYRITPAVYDSVSAAGIGVPPRMLMYRCRPEIFRLTHRNEFKYATFIGALHDFMDDHPELTAHWQILYDDRGHFILPSGYEFGLGTQAVNDFIDGLSRTGAAFMPTIGGFDIRADRCGDLRNSANPAHQFSAVMFIEKEGYRELLRNAKISERFDVAICSTKGLPNTALRRLLDALATYGIKVFCLHDFDIAGLTIANTLATSNKRYRFENELDFVDMGVRLADAEALGLESEPFKLDGKADLAKLRQRLRSYGATRQEIAHLVDRRHRIEIDAMTPAQLIEFIESKLTDNGVRKVVPDQQSLAAVYRDAVFKGRLERELAPLRAEMLDRLEAFAADQRVNADLDIAAPALAADVTTYLSQHSEKTWIDAVAAIARQHEAERANG